MRGIISATRPCCDIHEIGEIQTEAHSVKHVKMSVMNHHLRNSRIIVFFAGFDCGVPALDDQRARVPGWRLVHDADPVALEYVTVPRGRVLLILSVKHRRPQVDSYLL